MKVLFSTGRFGDQHIQRILSNIGWLCFERSAQIAVAMLISGVFARYFGPELFGKWQYANTLLAVIIPVTWVCGAEILVPTIVGRPEAELGDVLGSAFILRIGVSIVALLATWLWIGFGLIDRVVGSFLSALAVTMLFREPVVGVINAWLQSITFSRPQLLASVITAVAKAGVVYLLAQLSFGAQWFGWLWTSESAIIGIVMLAYFRRRHGGNLGWRVKKRLVTQFARSGFVFWFGLICMYLFLKIDRLMLAHRVSFIELGRYSAAQQLNESWIALTLMLAQTVAPSFVYRVHEIKQLRRNLVRLLIMAGGLLSAGACVLDVLSPLIITKIFGPAYVEAIRVFRAAVWLALPAGVEALTNLILLKYQAKYVVLIKWILSLVVAFIVNLLAIHCLGSIGALMGLAAGYVSATLINVAYTFVRLRGCTQRQLATETVRG